MEDDEQRYRQERFFFKMILYTGYSQQGG